jgi:putative flippase GtrA
MIRPVPEKLRYLAVGGVCAVLNNVVLIGGAAMGLNYTVCLIISFIVVVLFGYAAHTRITFTQPLSLRAFQRYAAAMLLNLPFSYLCLAFFCGYAKLPMIIGAPVTTVLTILCNYVLSRWAIVRRGPGAGAEGDTV